MLIQILKKAIHITALVFVLKSYAQEPVKSSCSQKLKEMQKSYEQGVLSSIPEALDQCMSNGFTKTEKLQGYRLIILTYLFLDETEKAEKKMDELLVYEPDYKPNKALDPVEYIKLFESFDVLPSFSFGLTLGVNQSQPKLVNSYSTGSETSGESKFTNGLGFNIGATADYLVVKNLYLNLDAYVYLRNFTQKQTVLTRSELTSQESQASFNLPVTLKYSFGKGKFRPYIRLGAGIDFLIVDQSQLIRKNIVSNQNDFAGASLDFKSIRNALNIYGVGGIGFSYKLGYGFLFLDARYIYGLSNFSKASSRYSDFKEKITQYGYVDPDFGINNVQLSLGYMYSLYKVKKKKSKTEVE